MTRKSLVDSNELIKRTEKEVNCWSHTKKIYYKERDTWTDEEKLRWRNAKSTVYARMRAENRDKTRNFWLKQMNNGLFEKFFEKYGLMICGDRVRFAKCGSPVLTSYLNEIVLPALEKEMGVSKVRLKSNYNTGMTNDLFNWEHAEVKEVNGSN